MQDERESEMSAQERSALALWLLMQRPMTTKEVADWLNVSPRGARRLLCAIGRVVPVYKVNHIWYICGKTEETRKKTELPGP